MGNIFKMSVLIVTFLSLSTIGIYTTLYHFYASGAANYVSQHICPSPPTYKSPEQLRYTGLAAFDLILCHLMVIFHSILESLDSHFMLHFLAGAPPVILAYRIEGARSDSSPSVRPVLVEMTYQIIGAASVLPLAWLALVTSSSSHSNAGRAPLTRVQAEAASLGVGLAFVLPTIAMIYLRNERLTAYWAIFPVYAWLIERVWLYIRRDAPDARAPGLPVVRAAFLTTAAIAIVPHLVTLYHTHPRHVGAFLDWLPPTGVPDPRTTTMQSAAYHFMRWDSIIWYTAAILAVSLLAGSRRETLGMLAAAPLASFVISPGAVVVLYWLRRESQLAERGKQAQARVRSVSARKNA